MRQALKEWLRKIRYKIAYFIAPDWVDDLENRFSVFLCEQTGSRLSKCYYSIETMRSAANDYQQRLCDECTSEVAREIIDEIIDALQSEQDKESELETNARDECDTVGVHIHQYAAEKLDTLVIALSVYKNKYTEAKK